MRERESRSPWFYIGIGCGLIALLLVIGLGIVAFVGFRSVSHFKKQLNDPQARAERVTELLGVETIPEGYHPGLSLSVPFVFDMAMMTDRPLDHEGQTDDSTTSLFLYFKFKMARGKFESYADGSSNPMEMFNDPRFSFDSVEELNEGQFTIGEMDVAYRASRGEFDTGDVRTEGLVTTMVLRCPQDDRMRMVIWTAADPAPEAPAEELDLSGTPADSARINAFLAPLDLCR